MGTPLYSTDIIPMTSRPTLTVMDDGDYFVILDTSTGKISKILKTNIMTALKITYDNTSGLTAETVQAALDELVVNLGSSDDAISALSGRLDTLEGTGAGSVAKAIDDALIPIEARLDSSELAIARHDQDLASVKQTLQQGNGATLDFEDIGIVSLDARATGRANPTIEGLTATNLVKNGDFSDGTTGWSTYFGEIIATGGILQMTSSSTTGGYAYCLVPIFLSGDSAFIKLRIRVTNAQCSKIRILVDDWISGVVFVKDILTPSENVWYTINENILISKSNIKRIVVQPQYVDSGVGKIMEIDGNYGVSAFNLTSTFGAGNEPNLETCQKLFSNYFSGTKSIQMPARVRSVGKNLFDKSKITNDKFINSGILSSGAGFSVSDYIRVEPSTSYYFNNFATNADTQCWFDINKNFISNFSTVPSNQTSPPNAAYYRGTLLTNNKDVAQITIGSTATTYEPYQDSTLYIADDSELRSVQTVYDTVSVANGEHMLTKRISTPVSVASGVAVNTTNYPTAKTGGKFSVELTAGGTQIGVIGTDSTSGAGMLRYELATPMITELLTSGILQAKPKGTVYYEPYYEGAHQTDASSQITLPYTGTIDKLTGYDENLEPYEIPSTGYTLVGTLLTITGAEENEVFYVELTRSEPLAPEMTINTLNNDQVTLDSVNGKYYKITFTTANGVPTTVATEVV